MDQCCEIYQKCKDCFICKCYNHKDITIFIIYDLIKYFSSISRAVILLVSEDIITNCFVEEYINETGKIYTKKKS